MAKLFERINGLLVEVPPSEADARRATSYFNRHHTQIDILFTPEEEAEYNRAVEAEQAQLAKEAAEREQARLAKEAAEQAIKAAEQAERDRKAAERAAKIPYLSGKLGITFADVEWILDNKS